MKIKILVCSILLVLGFSNSVFASKCYGKIKYSYILNAGGLYIYGDWRNEHTQICDLNAAWKGVTTEVCKGWLALTQAAKLADRQLVFAYDGDTSCGSIATYSSAPAPIYIMQQ